MAPSKLELGHIKNPLFAVLGSSDREGPLNELMRVLDKPIGRGMPGHRLLMLEAQ